MSTRSHIILFVGCIKCHNPSLELVTKARACKVSGQKGNPAVTPHTFANVRGCEGMNPHIPKGVSTLVVEVPMDCRMFKEKLQGPKPNGLRSSLYHWKTIET